MYGSTPYIPPFRHCYCDTEHFGQAGMTRLIDPYIGLCICSHASLRWAAVEHEESQHVERQHVFLHITDIVTPEDVHACKMLSSRHCEDKDYREHSISCTCPNNSAL